MKKTLTFVMAAFVISLMASCFGGSNEAQVSEKGKMLMANTWAADLNADLKGNSDAVEDATTIKHDIQLGGDVAKIGDFLAAKWNFGRGSKDPSKLVYSISTGEGFFSATVESGLWELSADDKTLLLRKWDDEKGDYVETPEEYTILELTAEKLSWQKKGDLSPSYFVAK